MNTNRTAITLLLLLLITVSFSSCKKTEVTELKEPPTAHIGKWQLVAAHYYMETGESVSPDYSHANIIYDFRKNNILIVSGEIEGIEDYRGHEIGEYFYTAFPIPTFNLAELKIGTDTLTYYYRFDNSIGTRLLPRIGTHMLLSHYLSKKASLDLVKIEESNEDHQ
ncbi:MAG TPA: hypothetical protein VKZ78_03755 [Sphingobacteriaceae bacterium]|nr:hypothetical protein [Sphingobacteriaceae bacterium]